MYEDISLLKEGLHIMRWQFKICCRCLSYLSRQAEGFEIQDFQTTGSYHQPHMHIDTSSATHISVSLGKPRYARNGSYLAVASYQCNLPVC